MLVGIFSTQARTIEIEGVRGQFNNSLALAVVGCPLFASFAVIDRGHDACDKVVYPENFSAMDITS